MTAKDTYTARVFVRRDGSEVEHLFTMRGTRSPGDETTYLVIPWGPCKHVELVRPFWIVKSAVIRERRIRVKVTP